MQIPMRTVALSLFALTLWAEPDALNVKFSDPSRPKTLVVKIGMGSIHVRGGNVSDVQIDAKGGWRSLSGKVPKEAEGLRPVRLSGGRDISVQESNNTVTVNGWQGSEMLVTVPPDTNLKLEASQGDVTVEGVTGEIEANSSMGAVKIREAMGAVLAHSSMGDVIATFSRSPEKPVSLASTMGKVDLTLPADAKATLLIREGNMTEVYSDFDVVSAGTVSKTEDYKGKIRNRQLSKATINGGGPEIQLINSMGDIMIRRRK